MAGTDDLRGIAGKALSDLEFRKRLLEDPETAVKEAGFELSGEQMKVLKEMDKETFEGGLEELDTRLTMGCWGKGFQGGYSWWV